MSGGKTATGRDERCFAKLSPETVELIAESLGIGNLAPAVAAALAEDATYRCRQIANVSRAQM